MRSLSGWEVLRLVVVCGSIICVSLSSMIPSYASEDARLCPVSSSGADLPNVLPYKPQYNVTNTKC